MKLDRNDYWTIESDSEDKMVAIVWTEQTAKMTDGDFKTALELLARYAEERSDPAILVDVRKFRHAMSPGLGVWRENEIVPRYNAAGIARFAYVIGRDFPAPPNKEPSKLAEGEDFLTGFFDRVEDARDWLSERKVQAQ